MHGVVQSKDIDAGVISTNIELPNLAGVAFVVLFSLLFNFGYYDPPGRNCWPCQHLRLLPPHGHSHCLRPHLPRPRFPRRTLCLFCQLALSQNPGNGFICFLMHWPDRSSLWKCCLRQLVYVEKHLLSNSLHGGRVLDLLLGKLGFGIHRFVNAALSTLDNVFLKCSHLNQRGSAALGVREGKSGEKLLQDIFTLHTGAKLLLKFNSISDSYSTLLWKCC